MLCQQQFEKVKEATRGMGAITPEKVSEILVALAGRLSDETGNIVAENAKDLSRMDKSDPRYDRLMLTADRSKGMAADLKNVAVLPAPCGELLEEKVLENGLKLKKVRVPLGVIGVIYEARPNVTVDVFSLCLRSGNACVLKGGSDAIDSNRFLIGLINQTLESFDVNPEIVQLLPPDRAAATELMQAHGYVDLLIPRGSQRLIDTVREQAQIPVIETGAGIVHTYVDKSADLAKAKSIVFNAKTRRVSVCNALDCLVLHQDLLPELPKMLSDMPSEKVEVFADEKAYEALKGNYPDALLHKATDADFGTEYLSYKMSVKTVCCIDKALDHIYTYSSKHSEAVIATDQMVIDRFLNEVDAAAVYANTSTAYTDGAQFGLGAEIGISTQKLHARGPMALRELTSYKWIIIGDGQVRPV